MTATEPSVREAAARVWSLIADHRAGRLPGEPGMPLGIALDLVQESGCERVDALNALRSVAYERLSWAGDSLPGRIYGSGTQWAAAARMALHYLSAQTLDIGIAAEQLLRAEGYRQHVVERQVERQNLDHQQWRERADWLAWAADARLAIVWLRELAAECAK